MGMQNNRIKILSNVHINNGTGQKKNILSNNPLIKDNEDKISK